MARGGESRGGGHDEAEGPAGGAPFVRSAPLPFPFRRLSRKVRMPLNGNSTISVV